VFDQIKFGLPFLTALLLTACSGGNSTGGFSSGSAAAEDVSASGAAAGVVGNSLGSSSSTGTVAWTERFRPLLGLLIEEAHASNACPTVKTVAGSGCTQNGNAADITLASCSYGASRATWTGTLEVTLSAGTAVTCGTFPATASIANNQSIQRQYVSGGSPGTAQRTSPFGTVVTVDHASANLANFDTGTTIAASIGSGYGTQVIFDGSGHRKGVEVNERIHSTKYDHSITGSLTVAESGSTRTISSGSITVFHNLLKVVGTAQFTNVVYNDSCATPVSGTITTTFAAGAHVSPTTAGSAVVGRSETLTFSSCGNQTLVDVTGRSSAVSVSGT
jgi:hypothetical protein